MMMNFVKAYRYTCIVHPLDIEAFDCMCFPCGRSSLYDEPRAVRLLGQNFGIKEHIYARAALSC